MMVCFCGGDCEKVVKEVPKFSSRLKYCRLFS